MDSAGPAAAAAAAEYNFLLFDSGQLISPSLSMLLLVDFISRPSLINALLLTDGARPILSPIFIKGCYHQNGFFGFG